jgi:SAM-dependent methyltransferase
MGQAPYTVAVQYDTVATEYADRFIGEHAKKPLDREILRKFAQALGKRQPVWDFGCGPGQTSTYLNDLGVRVSGLDLSEKLLLQAKALHPAINFRRGNILDLEFGRDSIAGIVAFYAIVHFSKEVVGIAFEEIFRVLQPDGLFLLTWHIGDDTLHVDEFLGKAVNLDFMFFRTDFIVHCLEISGFTEIDVIERDPYPDVEYQSRRAYALARKPSRE